MNNDLRRRIVDVVCRGRDGHIPSAYSIVDVVETLYHDVLRFDPKRPDWPDRDFFILSKGHGCVALYVVLEKHGFITERELAAFCRRGGLLGEHPDCTKIPGVEASTGSLGHGLPFAVGIALGLQIQNRHNRVFVLVGDGECHEGTIWEAANVGVNRHLGNLCVVVDWNGSAAQLMPEDDLAAKWRAFGWTTSVIDGHSLAALAAAFTSVAFAPRATPTVILARTVKGKGVPLLEGHGRWHHRIPTDAERELILTSLT